MDGSQVKISPGRQVANGAALLSAAIIGVFRARHQKRQAAHQHIATPKSSESPNTGPSDTA